MAASTRGALKALIESLGLGISAYADEPPPIAGGWDTPRPYVTISEDISSVMDPMEDGGSTGTLRETAQVDLWEDWKNLTTNAVLESYSLAPALRKGLHGKRLAPIGTAIVYNVSVVHSVRVPEPEENLAHRAITVEVSREL